MTELMPGNGNYYGANHPNMTPEEQLVEAVLAVAFELRTANLIACSQKVYLRDSPDMIRERMGEAPLAGKFEPSAPVVSCPTRLMDGRNEIRCWGVAGHEGECR